MAGVVQRLAYENDKLAGGARRDITVNTSLLCTLYYTPKESGFTFERGFDATAVTNLGCTAENIRAIFCAP